jgi:hypothetical protein
MKHLSSAELVDLVEDRSPDSGAVPERVRGHIAGCEACRAKADALRRVLARTLADEGTEPSPLFWDHFAARVGDTVRNETPGAEGAAAWMPGPVATWAVVAAAALLVMVTVVSRETLHAPAGAGPAVVSSSTPASTPAIDDVDADEAWAVVRTATEGLAWEDAHAVGLSAHPGSAERIALELTAEERSELGRLLAREMKRSGA